MSVAVVAVVAVVNSATAAPPCPTNQSVSPCCFFYLGHRCLLCCLCHLCFLFCFSYCSLLCFLYFLCLSMFQSLFLLNLLFFCYSSGYTRTDGSAILNLPATWFLVNTSSCFCCLCTAEFFLKNNVLCCVDNTCLAIFSKSSV